MGGCDKGGGTGTVINFGERAKSDESANKMQKTGGVGKIIRIKRLKKDGK